MNENFKNKIRILREKHFPGHSIRSLSTELESQLGEHFYAYLSKIEAGALPSIEFLNKIRNAYKLTNDEYIELLNLYMKQKVEDVSDRSGVAVETSAEPALLFRKVNKKKKL